VKSETGASFLTANRRRSQSSQKWNSLT